MVFISRLQANSYYAEILSAAELEGSATVDKVMAELCLSDLWFLLTVVMGRSDMNNRPEIDPDWLFARCMEVQADPDGYLDLWAREYYKSTIITFALTIQDILKDPEVTFGIFSVKRELAQDFLKQIKQEFENNEVLKRLFPDILYENPEAESDCWGLEKGIRVKRKANSREETVEAWGLFALPTGKHFKVILFDDVVTEASVTNPDQLSKAFAQFRLAFSLGCHGGKRRMIGTNYHLNDAWMSVIKAGTAIPRRHPATEDGTPLGKPVFLTAEALAVKRRDQGPYIFACQMLLDPVADEAQGFKEEWIRAWNVKHEYYDLMNIYILVDPAGEKKLLKTGSDYTVIWVIGLGADGRYYLIDGIRDRLNLTARTEKLFSFVRTYQPIRVGYEQYGMQADISHIEKEQASLNFHFDIIPLGGSMPKNDRIRRLVPVFEQGRFFTPGYLTICDKEGAFRDIIKEFKDEEYLMFPAISHDDMLDCAARILDTDLEAVFPDPDEYVLERGGYPNAPDTGMSNGVNIDPLAAA